jgi:uncharacterized protein YlzI (FlbEa/FlbD family)
MEPKFIELTNTDGEKFFVNILHIAWIEPGKNGTVLKSNFVNYSLSMKVKESYEEVKALIRSQN